MPVIPTLMGWGAIPDDHPLMAGMCGLQTSHRYGNATMLAVRLRARHRQPLGQPPHRLDRASTPRAASSCTSTSSRRRSAACSRPTSASSRTPRRRSSCSSQVGARVEGRRQAARTAAPGPRECRERKRTMLRKTNFDNVPMKPQRVYQSMNKAFGRDTCYVTHHRPVADRRRAVPARLQAAPLDQLRPGRPARLDHAGRARRARRRSRRARSSRCRATTTSSS